VRTRGLFYLDVDSRSVPPGWTDRSTLYMQAATDAIVAASMFVCGKQGCNSVAGD